METGNAVSTEQPSAGQAPPTDPDRAAIGSRRSLVTNSVYIFGARMVAMAISLFTVPFVIGHLGMGGYGTWESLMAVSAITNVIQTSLASTILWRVSQAFGAGDHEEVMRIVRTGLTIAMGIFLVLTPLAWLSRHAIVDLFHVPPAMRMTAVWILPLVVGVALLSGANEVIVSLVSGYQRSGLTTVLQGISMVVGSASVVICLLYGYGLVSLLVGAVVSLVIYDALVILAAWRATHHVRWLAPIVPVRAELLVMAPYAGFLLLQSASGVLRDQTDRIILATVASTTWTGYFGIAQRLASLIPIACTFFYVPTVAAAGASFAEGNWQKVTRLFRDVTLGMILVAGSVTVLLASLNDRLVIFWIGRYDHPVGVLLYLLLLGYSTSIIMTGPGTAVCKGVGAIRIEGISIAVGLALNVVFMFIFIKMIGATGTVVASSFSWFIGSLLYVWLLRRTVDLPLSETVRGFKAMALVLLTIVLARSVLTHIPLPLTRWTSLFQMVLLAPFILSAYLGLLRVFGVLPPGLIGKAWRRALAR